MEKAIGSEELQAALEKISSGDAKEASNGVSIAAGIEAESVAFYSRQAEEFKGTETEKFFVFLANQEKMHLEAINGLVDSLKERGVWVAPSLPRAARPKIFSKRDWDKGKKEGLTAVLFALWKEKQAQEFYEGIAKIVGDERVRGFFLALAEFEKGHAELLSEYAEDSYYTRELIMG